MRNEKARDLKKKLDEIKEKYLNKRKLNQSESG
jgi:ribosomal protein L29